MDYLSAILSTYDAATPDQVNAGTLWYRDMAATMLEHSLTSNLSIAQCAAIYAATSINTPWKRNVQLARIAINDGKLERGTLKMVLRKVNAIIAGCDIDTTLTKDKNSLKIVNFRRNLSGDEFSVTVDRWAYRIATNFGDCKCKASKHSCGMVPKGKLYNAIADAYRIAAEMRNVSPASMQAITWIVVRGTGE